MAKDHFAKAMDGLTCGEFLVDLTADQFPDQHQRVIVERVGESAWHATFANHRFYPLDLHPDAKWVQYANDVARLMDCV